MKQVCQYAVILLTIFLTGCGTVSNLKSIHEEIPLDLSHYTKVVVVDFTDEVTDKTKEAKREEKREEMKKAVRDFSDMIASELKKLGIFDEVMREGSMDENTLVVGGKITRHEKGNALARALIGFGAGSSYFEAEVQLQKRGSDEVLAIVKIDKNSWALGGAIAAGQNPEDFMKGAAKKIAAQIYKAKTGMELSARKDQKKSKK